MRPAKHERRKASRGEAGGADTRAINMRADDLVAADGIERVLEVPCPLPPQNGARNRHLIQGIASWRDNHIACLRHRHSESAHHLGSASEAVGEQNDWAQSAGCDGDERRVDRGGANVSDYGYDQSECRNEPMLTDRKGICPTSRWSRVATLRYHCLLRPVTSARERWAARVFQATRLLIASPGPDFIACGSLSRG